MTTVTAAIQADLEELVAIPSVSNRREECHRTLDYVQKALGPQHGLHVWEVEDQGVRSLVVGTHDSRRAKVILNAHLDVVWAPDEQFMPRVEKGLLYGRGTYDMKGAGAVYLQILRDLAASDPATRPDVQVQFVTDEEIGGHHGACKLVDEGFTGGLFIAGEPTDLNICYQAKGLLWVTVRQPGRPGHAAMPWQAENPLLALHRGLGRLLEAYPQPATAEWRTTVTPTGIEAGGSHNRVPDLASLKLDIRHVPADPATRLKQELRAAFPEATLELVQESYALDTDPEADEVQRLVELQNAELGHPPTLYSEHFASDARYWGRLGVPSVCWGPAGAGMHASDERVDLQSLETYYRLVRQLVGLR